MARGGDPRRIHDRRSRARSRSASPSPADGGAGAISEAARISAAEVAAAPVRGCSVPPRRGDEGVSSRQQLESLRVTSLMERPQAKMAHPQLRLLLSGAMAWMNKAPLIDDTVLDEFLQDISNALLGADFNPGMVSELQSKVKSSVDLAASGSKHSIHQAVIKQLCRLIDSGKKPGFVPKKGKPCVVLMIGLQGSGKTTCCAKFAYHHLLKGHSPSLVSADTRGEQDFGRLKQIAHEAKIPFYGSYTESDPVKIALQGVEKFTNEKSDLIIIDTGCGEDFLSKIDKAVQPDLTILVVDARGGRFTFNEAQVFKKRVSVDSVFVTKMDAYSNGGGTLNALAAARLPVIMLGTGKQIHEYAIFDVKLFANHLLDHKGRSILIDTEDMHMIFDNLKLSDTVRMNAMNEVVKECRNAYNAVLDKHKVLLQQICCLESKYKILCDVLGEKNLKNEDIQPANTLEERHRLVLISIRSLEKEKNSRTKKLQVLLSKGLASLDFLGLTNSEQRKYQCMLENLSSYVQQANSLSTKSLEKLETRVKELEVKKAEHPYQSKHWILRHSQNYIRGGTKDRGGLEDLIKMAVVWESKHSEPLLYENKGLLIQLKTLQERLLQLNSDTSCHRDAKSDTEMGHSTSSSRSDTEMGHSTSSSRSDTEMGQSTSSGSSRSDSNDPDYSPESTDSSVEMGHLVVSESSDSMSAGRD